MLIVARESTGRYGHRARENRDYSRSFASQQCRIAAIPDQTLAAQDGERHFHAIVTLDHHLRHLDLGRVRRTLGVAPAGGAHGAIAGEPSG
jgi:hypothetical protein